MLILGLNAFHADSAACIVHDGVLIAAAEEERFRRVKHWAGFPSKAIHWCLVEAGVELAAIDAVALNQDSRANLWRKLLYAGARSPDIRLIAERLRNRRRRANVKELLEQACAAKNYRGKIHAVEHHLAHLSSAFHVSPFDRAVAVSVDGFGDFASTAWGVGSGAGLSVEGRVLFPHSLGIFYQAITQHLGFPHYGDEYKVMGLAPYGEPAYLGEMERIVRLKPDGTFALDLSFFRHHRERLQYQWEEGSPVFNDLFSPALESLLGRRVRRTPRSPNTIRTSQAPPRRCTSRPFSISSTCCNDEAGLLTLSSPAAAPTIPSPMERYGAKRIFAESTSTQRRGTPVAPSARPLRSGTEWAAIGASR